GELGRELRSVGARKRDVNREHAAVAGVLLHEETAIHPRGDRPTHVETGPHARRVRRGRAARETFEDPVAVRWIDTRATVADANDGVVARRTGRDLDRRSSRAVSRRVLQEVVEDLVEARWIGADHERRARGVDRDLATGIERLDTTSRSASRFNEIEGL